MQITVEMALEGLGKAVDQRGHDYVDPNATMVGGGGCKYQRKGEASCIVGTALWYLGVGIDALKDMDGGFDTIINSLETKAVLSDYGFDLEADAVKAFGAAQAEQDGGKSWGTALAAADHVF